MESVRVKLMRRIEEGDLKERLIERAQENPPAKLLGSRSASGSNLGSPHPSPNLLLTPDEAVECFESFLNDFFQSQRPPPSPSPTPSTPTPASPSPSLLPSPGTTSEEIKQAIQNGDVLQLNRVLKKTEIDQFMGMMVNPELGYNALHYACLEGQYQVVHLLLKKKADPTVIAEMESVFAIHLFLREGLEKAIAKAMEKNQEKVEEETEPKYSFLVPVVQRLLAGVDIDFRTNTGDTLLHYACANAPAEVAQILFDKGANPNLANNNGYLPFHILMDNYNIPEQKHLLLQMMQDTLNVESISDCLGGYLEAAAQAKNKELFNTLVQFEYDIEEEVYFKPGLLDFPSELSSAKEGSIALLKYATYERLIQRVVEENHGDEEAYAAFCFKIHVFGGLGEVLEKILGLYARSRGVGVCKFLSYFFGQSFIEKGDPLCDRTLRTLPPPGKGTIEEENLRNVISNQPWHAERAEILAHLDMFGAFGEVPCNNFVASDVAKHLTMWNMSLHQILSEIDLIRYAEFSAKVAEGKTEILDESINSSLHRVQNAITFFNNVSFWAAATVILEEGVEARRDKLTFVIKVMDLCIMIKNYNTAFAVLLGLKLRAVSQVGGLFDSLEDAIMERFKAISEVFSYQGSYKNYREALKGVHAPGIPYLGLLLRDLTYANDGSADFSGKKQNFNFYKQRRISKLARQYHTSLMTKPYDFNLSQEIAKGLARINEMSFLVNEETLLTVSNTKSKNFAKKSNESDLSDTKQNLRDLFYGNYERKKKTTPTPFNSSDMDTPFFSTVSEKLGGKGGGKGGGGGEALEALKSENVMLFQSLKEMSAKEGEVENYRVAVTSMDGFSLGHLDMVPHPNNPKKTRLQLSMRNSQAKSVIFRLERLEQYPGKCIALYSAECNCYVGIEGEIGDEGQKIHNCIDTTTPKWRIHVNQDFSEPQQFYTEIQDDIEVLRAGTTKEPLQFTLQRVNNIVKSALPELERLGLTPGTSAKPKSKKGFKRILG